MQRALQRMFLLVLLLPQGAGIARARPLPAPASGVAAALGPVGIAFPDLGAGVDGNPALLAGADRAASSIEWGLESDAAGPQRVGLVLPTWDHLGFGIDVARSHAAALDGERRRTEWRLGVGRGLGTRLAIGAALRLRRESIAGASDTSDGLDLGVNAMAWSSGRNRLDIGAVVRGAVRPVVRFGAADFEDPRRLETAAGWTRAISPSWRLGGGIAATTSSSERGTVWLGARAGWRSRLDLTGALSRHTGRIGCGIRVGDVRVESMLGGGDESRVALALHWEFGASLAAERMQARERAEALDSERLTREIAARQSRQVEVWLDDAGAAAARHDHTQATQLYRNVLLWSPEHTEAREGLRRAQHAAMMLQADSLVASKDLWSASSQLESVLRLFPEDSLATSQLQDIRRTMRRADRTRSDAVEQLRLGMDAYAAQRYNAAVRCFEAAHKLDPQNGAANEFLEYAHAALQRQADALVEQARGKLEKRDLDAARADLKSALDLVATHVEARQILTQVDRDSERLAQDKRLQERRGADRRLAAARHDESSREDRAPVPPAVLSAGYEHGMQMYRSGDLVAAMQAWEELARQAPHYEEVDHYLLRVYRVCGLERYTEGHLQEAIGIWGKALQLEPENAQVRRYMNQANAKLKRVQEPRGSR